MTCARRSATCRSRSAPTRRRAERPLEHFAILKGIVEPGASREVVGSLLRQTNLWEVRRQKLGTFSGGMRQRFGVVALLGNPKLLYTSPLGCASSRSRVTRAS